MEAFNLFNMGYTDEQRFFEGLLKVEDANSFKAKNFLREARLQPNQFMYLQDVVQRRFYKKGIQIALGYNFEELTADFFIKHIHPADLTMYLKLSKAYRKFVCYNKEQINQTLHSLQMNFRIRKADGTYIPLLRTIKPLIVNDDNEVEVFVSQCTDVSLFNPTNQIKWKVYGPDAHLFDQYVNDKELGDKELFSGRELEVLGLLVKGYSSSRIANVLFVSVNTVNTHRKSLMKKANVNKTIDLISFASEYGYI
ncbi:LuxR C-terminal-related transcriptional regulator [Reichenbachiella versicolor]|uniref:LuxR C-terminal-related transcriptional regulator n=1 Tax=Reichenbachiella versicolor TaxID=1821036 RepID=UPI000D6E189F|nr:LuxR C-terminal-related transcriptional regulator [Reichenbachiella versicolor]